MQLSKTLLFLTATAFIAFASCNNADKKNNTDSTGTEIVKTGTESSNKNGRYEIKSGIVEYTTSMMGVEGVKQVEMFDDYGNKQASSTEMNFQGQKIVTHAIIKDGFVYTYNEGEKTGQKMKMPDLQNINFNNLTDSIKQVMNIKEEGEETFLGKTAKKFSINAPQNGMTGELLVWKGIPLKSTIQAGGGQVNTAATKVEENPSIPASEFELPADVTFTELSAPPAAQ